MVHRLEGQQYRQHVIMEQGHVRVLDRLDYVPEEVGPVAEVTVETREKSD